MTTSYKGDSGLQETPHLRGADERVPCLVNDIKLDGKTHPNA